MVFVLRPTSNYGFLNLRRSADTKDRVLELRREMGVLRRREFDAETRLHTLTVAAQAAVDVVAPSPALLVDQLRALPNYVRGQCAPGYTEGRWRLWAWPMHNRTTRGSPSSRQWP
jgi:hypothetical protein